MFRRRNISLDRTAAALEALQRALPERQAHFDALVATIRDGRHDRRRVREVGLALDEIAQGKLYRLRRYPNFAALLDELGMSRVVAHRWRVVARACDEAAIAELGIEAAYERSRSERTRPTDPGAPTHAARGDKRTRPTDPGAPTRAARGGKRTRPPDPPTAHKDERASPEALAAALRDQGIGEARVELVRRGRRTLARIEIAADDCARLLSLLSLRRSRSRG